MFTLGCSTSTVIFQLVLSLKVTPEGTLHSRIKHSITHISIVISLLHFKEDCYFNVKYDFTKYYFGYELR